MIDPKIAITGHILTQTLGKKPTYKEVYDQLRKFWKNPRLNGIRSLSLTSEGYEYFSNHLKFYEIELTAAPDPINRKLLWLDRHIDCPYYIDHTRIFISREKTAIHLLLYGGDLDRFVYNIANISDDES